MNIVCTLKEFEQLSARCPMNNYLINDEESEELLDKCFKHCILSGVCQYGKADANWTLADLVTIIPISGGSTSGS